MLPGFLAEALRLNHLSQPFVIEHRDERCALFKVFLLLLTSQPSGTNNQLMDKEGFWDRETNAETIKDGGLGEVDQDADERKRQRVDMPFPDRQGSDLSPSRTMCDKFDLVAAGGKFLHPFGGHEIDKTEIGD